MGAAQLFGVWSLSGLLLQLQSGSSPLICPLFRVVHSMESSLQVRRLPYSSQAMMLSCSWVFFRLKPMESTCCCFHFNVTASRSRAHEMLWLPGRHA